MSARHGWWQALLAVALGVVAAIASIRAPAHACGIGVDTPTMLANSVPAMPFSASVTPPDGVSGIFLAATLAGAPTRFDEDISAMVSVTSKDALQWRWSFGDGSGYAYAQQPEHTYARAGTYLVRVQTYEPSDNTWADFDGAQMTVLAAAPAHPPVAAFDAPPPVGMESEVTFDAGASRSADGSPLTYAWNFDDGGTAEGVRVSHQFTSPGAGLVALVVTDAHGASTVVTHAIKVVPALPVAALAQRSWLAVQGLPLTLDASRSTPPDDPPGDTLAHFVWHFGDGTPDQTTSGPFVTHSFRGSGSYVVMVQAVEGIGGAAGIASLRVSVMPGLVPPLAALFLALAVLVAVVMRTPWGREWRRAGRGFSPNGPRLDTAA